MSFKFEFPIESEIALVSHSDGYMDGWEFYQQKAKINDRLFFNGIVWMSIQDVIGDSFKQDCPKNWIAV